MEAALSTAAGVEDVKKGDGTIAAVATRRAADIYDVEILAREIQETSTNVTRFVVLSSADHEPTGSDRTSLCFSFDDDKPGLLVEVLREFARAEHKPGKDRVQAFQGEPGPIYLPGGPGRAQEAVAGEGRHRDGGKGYIQAKHFWIVSQVHGGVTETASQ